MNRFKRFFYLAVAVVVVFGTLLLLPTPAVGGDCDCVGGYNYAFDEQPCSPGGTNCAVCHCPPQSPTPENKG